MNISSLASAVFGFSIDNGHKVIDNTCHMDIDDKNRIDDISNTWIIIPAQQMNREISNRMKIIDFMRALRIQNLFLPGFPVMSFQFPTRMAARTLLSNLLMFIS